jgi:arginine deiminase
VVLGYDRNDKTVEAFRNHGFTIIEAEEFIREAENNNLNIDELEDLLILVPSAELSRARGGFHCMSMPILRDDLE